MDSHKKFQRTLEEILTGNTIHQCGISNDDLKYVHEYLSLLNEGTEVSWLKTLTVAFYANLDCIKPCPFCGEELQPGLVIMAEFKSGHYSRDESVSTEFCYDREACRMRAATSKLSPREAVNRITGRFTEGFSFNARP